jgi:predicted dehydrogenase
LSPPLSIVQVGAGFWGQSWAELVARARGLRLAGVVDRARAARDWAAAALDCPTFRDLSTALALVSCDAVLIVAPPHAHRLLAEEALAAGRHVAIEKPLALDLADARAIGAAAVRAGRSAIVTQNYRFRRQSRALRRLVQDGTLGRLRGGWISCRRDLRRDPAAMAWRSRMPHPYLFDMAIHHVDLLRMITGRELAQVDARSWPAAGGPFRSDAAVVGVVSLEGGAEFGYEGSWVAPSRWTSWNGDWELVGTRGVAEWTGGVGNALRGHVHLEEKGAERRRLALPQLPALDRLGILHELRRAVAAGVEPECSVADNVRSLAGVLALARSSEERRPVRVAEVLA